MGENMYINTFKTITITKITSLTVKTKITITYE